MDAQNPTKTREESRIDSTPNVFQTGCCEARTDQSTEARYHIRILDESGCSLTFIAASLDEAKDKTKAYRDEADWEHEKTLYVEYMLYRLQGLALRPSILGNDHWIDPALLDDCESWNMNHRIDPEPPKCTEAEGLGGTDHEFIATKEHEGGLEENPGVFGHGGGVIISDHCRFCGLERTTDTWDQGWNDGEPRESIKYGDTPQDWKAEDRSGNKMAECGHCHGLFDSNKCGPDEDNEGCVICDTCAACCGNDAAGTCDLMHEKDRILTCPECHGCDDTKCEGYCTDVDCRCSKKEALN